MKVFLTAGARPNFMKIAPVYRESLKYAQIDCRIVHTGQHYDYRMSETFFRELGMPEPHHHLGSGTGSHAVQTARIMTEFEKACEREQPELVIVVGDVNSTLACSVVSKKMGCELAHVEAGLRSFDMSMPEEINRRVTDSLTDYFFVTEGSAIKNLLREGKDYGNIHFVGNVMVDNLLHQLDELHKCDPRSFSTFSLKKKYRDYAFVTLHRPSNVDCPDRFNGIAQALNQIASERAVFFPLHPRTAQKIKQFGIRFSPTIHLLPPLGFRESLWLWKDAAAVLTDSGGLQEETTALGVPCITIRENTERPITIEMGSNILAGTTPEGIMNSYRKSLTGKGRAGIPHRWDGHASERIWKVLTGLRG